MRPRTSRLLYAATAVADTWLAGRPEAWAARARRATKPALMPLLAIRLREAPATPQTPLHTPSAIALAAGWAGDVALLSDGQRAFLAGLGSFAVGHAAYVVGLRHLRAPGPAVAATGPRMALLGGLALGPLLAQAAGRRDPGLRAPVAAYAALLAGTAASATHLDTAVPREARLLLGAGAWLFLVSDSVLGLRAFVLTGPAPWAERTVMATYTLAQALLVEGTLRT